MLLAEIEPEVPTLTLAEIGEVSADDFKTMAPHQKKGVNYILPAGNKLSKNSRTYDNARGGHKVSWTDAANVD